MHKKLFIPGPTEVRDDVLEKMSTPMIGHRSKDASVLQRSISEKMMKLLYTENQILLSTSSGSGFMEAAIRSCTKKRAAVFAVGAFGKRWHDMAKANGVPADLFEVEWGKHTTPEMVDEALSSGKYDLVTVTHNETSTGIMNPVAEKIEVDKWGVDICVTSTQKALALPPGLAICTISEKAVKRAETVENRGFYLDILRVYKYIGKKDHQYPSTPNLSLMI